MADEIKIWYSATGATLYAVTFNPWTGRVRDVVADAWDLISNTDWNDYDTALTEQDVSSQIYYADIPTGLNRICPYDVLIYLQAGGSPATTDKVVGNATLNTAFNGLVVNYGTAGIEGGGNVVLDTNTAVATDDYYNGMLMVITEGTGAGQVGVITDYSAAGTSATVSFPGGVSVTSSEYAILAVTDPWISGASRRLDTLGEQGVADELLDRTDGVESSRTVREALRLILAASAGKLSGAATTTIAIRDTSDTKDRISATVDASGNRSAITLDAT